MQSTPPTQPLPERRSRAPFHLTVACLSVIAGLVLGVGGFFGVRVIQGPDGIGAGGTSTEDGGTPEVLAETPVGPDEAVAHDVVLPVEPTLDSGRVDVRIGAVDWDANAELQEANPINDEPAAGNELIMVTNEGVHRGDEAFTSYAGHWIDLTYVDDDGVEHARGPQVPPLFDEMQQQEAVEPTQEVLSQAAFEVPETVEEEGFFVLAVRGDEVQEGAWVRAS